MIKENKEKHLEFIQNVISRMNSNSFQIKGLSITIVSALYALSSSTSNNDFILITLLPLVVFWLLDSFYLQQERKFVGLYSMIINDEELKIKSFEMRPDLIKGKRYSFLSSAFSKTTFLLYFPISLLTIIIYYFK